LRSADFVGSKQYKIIFARAKARNSVYFDNSLDILYISHWGRDIRRALFVQHNFEDAKKLERLAGTMNTFIDLLEPPIIIQALRPPVNTLAYLLAQPITVITKAAPVFPSMD
jgi:hypothetical protein